MKKNNKGFMLAEVVVTSTILLVIMIGLFFTFNKIYTRYNNITAYKNIDGMYALDNFMEYIINERTDDNINKVISKVDGDYLFIIDRNECKKKNNVDIIESGYCNNLKNGYNIENLIIIKQRQQSVENLLNSLNAEENKNIYNNTLRDYIKYIQKYYALWTSGSNTRTANYNKNSYIVIIEFKTEGNSSNEEIIYNYSSLELR